MAEWMCDSAHFEHNHLCAHRDIARDIQMWRMNMCFDGRMVWGVSCPSIWVYLDHNTLTYVGWGQKVFISCSIRYILKLCSTFPYYTWQFNECQCLIIQFGGHWDKNFPGSAFFGTGMIRHWCNVYRLFPSICWLNAEEAMKVTCLLFEMSEPV